MKKVKWVGDTRDLPPYGRMENGRVIDLPSKIADSLKQQGLVEFVNKSRSKEEK